MSDDLADRIARGSSTLATGRFDVATPLGVRLWDPCLDAPVTDGMIVTAAPIRASDEPDLEARVRAGCTPSGVFAFPRLPGLGAWRMKDPAEVAADQTSRPFWLEVRDRRGRFLPIARRVMAPARDLSPGDAGPFLSSARPKPTGGDEPGLFVFSAPSRVAPTGCAAVRGTLRWRSADAPVAHAWLEFAIDGQAGAGGLGLSSADGSFAIVLPWPSLQGMTTGSPPIPQSPLDQLEWTLRLDVFATPGGPVAPAGAVAPELGIIGAQARAEFVDRNGSVLGATLTARLAFGRDTTLRTDGSSWLLVEPRPTSP